MAWNISREGNLLTIAFDGRLVAAVAPSLREDVIGRISEGTNVLFDLGKMVLAALQPGPKIVFDITKVSRVFEIVPTVADAKF